VVIFIQLSKRQEKIIEIVKTNQPITGEEIANCLNLNRSTLRIDLSILTMFGILDARPRVGYFFTGKTSMGFVADKIKNILVKDVKSTPVVVDESTTTYDAIVAMFLEDVGSIYRSKEGKLAGVVSRKDIIRAIMGGTDLFKVSVGIIMTRMPNIVCVKPEDSILIAANKLIEHEIDSIPVVEYKSDDSKDLIVTGRITKTSITRIFVELGNNI